LEPETPCLSTTCRRRPKKCYDPWQALSQSINTQLEVLVFKTSIGTAVRGLSALALVVASFGSAHAGVVYGFGGTSNGGVGSATLEFDVVGNTLTVKVNNLSPTLLIDGSGPNTPGITGFGFNLDPASLVLGAWSLKAFDTSNTEVTIGSGTGGPSNNTCSGCDWVIDDFLAGVTLDYLPTTGGQTDGSLYNPAATVGSMGQNSIFFTTATLTMSFDQAPSLNDTADWSPFVRMQQVGNGGSLRLPGEENCVPAPDNAFCGQQQIPEPSALALVALGLVGMGALGRRRKTL
jgi:PEP-CTERM motif